MVELMAVLIIIGLLAAAAVGTFMGRIDKAKVSTTRASLKTLHTQVLQFKMDTGRFPTEDEGLDFIREKEYWTELFKIRY